jgi:integrase
LNSLQGALDEYLAVRRALGYKLHATGLLLQQFIEFVELERAKYITTELALKWATRPQQATPARWADRLGVVRRFAKYCHADDPRNVVPPPDLLPERYRRVPPYLYSDDQIHRLITAARKLPSAVGLRPHTFATLFGLYVAAGLRAREALKLRRDDVDLGGGVLTIRGSKFGKSRYVPVHASTQRALQRYATLRDRLLADQASPCFFLSDQGTQIAYPTLRKTFVNISHQIGLRVRGDTHGPRIHDFRHRLAIQTLLKWYRSGVDVERRMPQLSTYLGHVHITDTQWYLTATPQLLRHALNRVEQSEGRKRT